MFTKIINMVAIFATMVLYFGAQKNRLIDTALLNLILFYISKI